MGGSQGIFQFSMASVNKASTVTQLPPFHTHIFFLFRHFSLKFDPK